MTIDSNAPKAVFRPSMLIYDTRYRSMTIQIVFLFGFMALAAWLVQNAISNLTAQGKVDFNLNFLWDRAGYDINQRLVEYSSDSTHGQALLVGLLNTLLVSAMACVTATIIGVIAGVLRLSKNWLIGRLMTVYVEMFRNVPLLLWILIFFAILTEAMPVPNAFRGDDATASMLLNESVAITNRYVVMPEPLFSNSLGDVDVWLFLVSNDLLALLAVIFASVFMNRKLLARATAIQNATGVRPATWWQSLLVLFGPVVVLLWALGFHLGYPELKGFNFVGGTQLRNSLVAMWLSLSLYTGSYIAEIVRAGILAVSKGQSEASFALGLRPNKTLKLVVLPQALRVIIPPLISQYLNATKNSSLGLAVGYMDLRSTLGGVTLNQTGRALECVLLMMFIYLCISLLISGVMNIYNNSVKLKER